MREAPSRIFQPVTVGHGSPQSPAGLGSLVGDAPQLQGAVTDTRQESLMSTFMVSFI